MRRLFPFLERVIADGAYQGRETARAVRRAARARLEIVKRSDAAKGFVVLPEALDCGTHVRLVGALPPSGQRLRGADAHPSGLCSTGDDPPHDAPDRKSLKSS